MEGKITPEEKELVEEGINQMLKKGAIIKVDPSPEQFLSNNFAVPKKDGVNRSVMNLKRLNNFIHCPHFKIEILCLVRELLLLSDWMYKLDLEDACFSIPTHRNSQKNLCFVWEDSLYQFFCL